jgi:hypothetical protein
MKQPERPRKADPMPAILLCVCLVIAAALGSGMMYYGSTLGEAGRMFLAMGGLGLIVTVAIAPIGFMLVSAGRRVAAGGGDTRDLAKAVERFVEHGSLSDEARRVLYRRHDRELLRQAIQEDIAAEDWDAAMVLVKELAERFGYRSDAEEFRARIEQSRFDTVQRKVTEAIAQLDDLIMSRRWDQASTEAARIGRLYPDSPRVEGLRHRVEQARLLYKSDLERRFLLSAGENRIDDAMEMLRELDAYLTEDEAEPFREVARGVIGKARDNLGAQFKLAVQDRRWDRAAQIGEQIIDQFPNSRMAQEVRGLLDSIRARLRQMPVAR